MKLLKERNYRELFRIGILLKAADGIFELVAGFFIYFINTDIVSRTLFYIFRNEITETPRDALWTHVLNAWHSFSLQGHFFWGLLFIAHGIVKIFFAIALLKNRLWAYPTAATVFSLLVIYQIYSFAMGASAFLGLLIVIDIIVIALIVHEYLVIKRKTT